MSPGNARHFGSLKFEDWPQTDRNLLEIALAPKAFLRPGGPASGWRKSTLDTVKYRYGVYLWWLRETGRLQPGSEAIGKVTMENIGPFVEAYGADHASTSLAAVVHGVYEMTRIMYPEVDHSWLLVVVGALKSNAKPRPKLPRMADHGALIRLGQALIEHGANRVEEDHLLSALAIRDGCMILFEVACPLRRRNFEALRLGHTLVRDEVGYRVSFSGHEMKNQKPFEADLPGWLARHLDFYIDKARGVLARRSRKGDAAALWLGAEGEPISGKAMSRHIRQLVTRHLGRAMSLHLFRDGAATTIAIVASADVGIAGDVLGHADPRTAERNYNQARGVEAARRYHGILARLRDRRHDSDRTDLDRPE